MATVYVLKNGVEGFYTGDKYINSEGVFAVVDKNINGAKAYSSLSVAKKACARLNETIENGPYQFKIMVVDKKKKDKIKKPIDNRSEIRYNEDILDTDGDITGAVGVTAEQFEKQVEKFAEIAAETPFIGDNG